MMSLDLGQAQDGASRLLKLLAEEASEVNILFHASDASLSGTTSPGIGRAGVQSAEQILQLRPLLTELGKHVTLSFF